MQDNVEPLILDLVEWVSKEARPYADVMEAWRTSCPRLTVWEDAIDRGFLVRRRIDGRGVMIMVTPSGRRFLAQSGQARPAPA
jgi:hypothetical protein